MTSGMMFMVTMSNAPPRSASRPPMKIGIRASSTAVADAVVAQRGEGIDVVVERDDVIRAEAAHGQGEDAAAGADVESAFSGDVERFQDLDAERRRLVRAGSEGLLLRDDERVTRRVARDQRRIGRDDEVLADEQRLERLLIAIEPVDAFAVVACSSTADDSPSSRAASSRSSAIVKVRGDRGRAVRLGRRTAGRWRQVQPRLHELLERGVARIEGDLEDEVLHACAPNSSP